MIRATYLAIPSHKALYLAGNEDGAFANTCACWDLGWGYEITHTETETLFRVDRRGARKELRERLLLVYGFKARTVVGK